MKPYLNLAPGGGNSASSGLTLLSLQADMPQPSERRMAANTWRMLVAALQGGREVADDGTDHEYFRLGRCFAISSPKVA